MRHDNGLPLSFIRLTVLTAAFSYNGDDMVDILLDFRSLDGSLLVKKR
jgi:hypothetical protein